MKDNELKNLVKNIAEEERLYKLLVINEKIGIRKIKQVIREIFKKYRTYNYVENFLLDAIFATRDIKASKFDKMEKEKLEKFNELLEDKVMSQYYLILNKDSILYLTLFLIENKIDFFEKELVYSYDSIKCSEDELVSIIEEAKSNTTLNITKNEKVDYYDSYIMELNLSLKSHLDELKAN